MGKKSEKTFDLVRERNGLLLGVLNASVRGREIGRCSLIADEGSNPGGWRAYRCDPWARRMVR